MMVEFVMSFRELPDFELYDSALIFYVVSTPGRTIIIGEPHLTEENCVSVFNHEAIEMLVAVESMVDGEYYSLHGLIGNLNKTQYL